MKVFQIKTQEGFFDRLRAKMTVDKHDTIFRAGSLRGKIEGDEFYFYESKDSERPFTTVISGKLEGDTVTYSYKKNFYSRIIMCTASLLWAIFAAYLYFTAIELLPFSLIGLPFIFGPNFIYKKADKKYLKKQLEILCQTQLTEISK